MSSHLMEVRERNTSVEFKIPSNHFSFHLLSHSLIIHNNQLNDDEFKNYVWMSHFAVFITPSSGNIISTR